MTTPTWFDARLSTGNLLTIGTVLIGLVAGWFQFDNRLALAEDRFSRQVESDANARASVERRLDRIETERADMRDRVIRIEEQLKAQDQKLDIILRSVRRPEPNIRQ